MGAAQLENWHSSRTGRLEREEKQWAEATHIFADFDTKASWRRPVHVS